MNVWLLLGIVYLAIAIAVFMLPKAHMGEDYDG